MLTRPALSASASRLMAACDVLFPEWSDWLAGRPTMQTGKSLPGARPPASDKGVNQPMTLRASKNPDGFARWNRNRAPSVFSTAIAWDSRA